MTNYHSGIGKQGYNHGYAFKKPELPKDKKDHKAYLEAHKAGYLDSAEIENQDRLEAEDSYDKKGYSNLHDKASRKDK